MSNSSLHYQIYSFSYKTTSNTFYKATLIYYLKFKFVHQNGFYNIVFFLISESRATPVNNGICPNKMIKIFTFIVPIYPNINFLYFVYATHLKYLHNRLTTQQFAKRRLGISTSSDYFINSRNFRIVNKPISLINRANKINPNPFTRI